jgi:hypothetical protein
MIRVTRSAALEPTSLLPRPLERGTTTTKTALAPMITMAPMTAASRRHRSWAQLGRLWIRPRLIGTTFDSSSAYRG